MERYVIDRFEGDFVVLEKSDGTTIDVEKTEIPTAKEGDVLILENGVYTIDKEDTQERKKRIEEKMKKLFGGH